MPTHLPTLADVEAASELVYGVMPPTPQYEYPLLNQRTGVKVWVKHENHTPLGAFKMRGGLVYLHHLLEVQPDIHHVVTATKGNHGQSIALAAAQYGLKATIVVPTNNSQCTNAAMRALGAQVISHGQGLQDAIARAQHLSQEPGWHLVPSYHPWLLQGVATYPWELFRAVPKLDAVYVAIGKGSGLCATIAMRNALSPSTEVIGVSAQGAPAFAQAFLTGEMVDTGTARTMACGIAVTRTEEASLQVIRQGASRIVTVSDPEIQQAMAVYFHDTHNIACGAGAASLAALLQEREQMRGRRVAVILSGGNVDWSVWQAAVAQADV